MNNLKKKVLQGLAGLMIFWGLLMFLPAWTLDYWQGWVYYTIFFLFSIIGTLYFLKKDPKLIERRMNAGPAAEQEPSQKIIQAITGTLCFAMIAFPGLDHRFHWSNVPVYLVIFSNLMFALGYWFIFRVFSENSFASSIIQVEDEQKVISTGPYAYIRHPMYSGALLWFIFSPMAMGSYYALIFGVMVCLALAVRTIYEEKYLLENLKGYKEYCEKVRFRLIPFIW